MNLMYPLQKQTGLLLRNCLGNGIRMERSPKNIPVNTMKSLQTVKTTTELLKKNTNQRITATKKKFMNHTLLQSKAVTGKL